MTGWRLRHIARMLDRGALIVHPTDTIWGFGCHPLRPGAVTRLLRIKQRPMHKGLILLGSTAEQFFPFVPDELHSRLTGLESTSGQPTTWVVPAADDCPPWISPDGRTLALRLTGHPQIAALCARLGSPLVSTSANRSGRPPVRNTWIALRHFGPWVDAIIGGFDQGTGQASRIRDLQSGRILRP